MVSFLKDQNVKHFTTYNYAHKARIAEKINEWIYEFSNLYKNTIPFGCVWPGDKKRVEYIKKIFNSYEFYGIKIQPLVQNFYPFDDRMDEIYKIIIDKGK